MSDLFRLDGKVALIIGAAAGGLGANAAQALSGAGATVALADLQNRRSDVEQTALECDLSTTHDVEVTDEGSVTQLVEKVVENHGRIDILVCAAGVMLRKELEETQLHEWQQVINVNLTGTWIANRAVAPVMRQQKSGKIINFSTVYAERVGPIPESAYYASKAGIVNVTRSVASELGPFGVTVNCLAPAVFFPTRMTSALAEDPEKLEWFAGRTMLGRLGNPEQDLAGPLLLLASDASSYITGQVLYVDGGWSAW